MTQSFEQNLKCDDCGREYILLSHKFPVRERGSCNCKCGKSLYEYNGSTHYSIRESEASVVNRQPDENGST